MVWFLVYLVLVVMVVLLESPASLIFEGMIFLLL
jgi:hypothetical protein